MVEILVMEGGAVFLFALVFSARSGLLPKLVNLKLKSTAIEKNFS